MTNGVRNPGLDGVRGIAIALVVAAHALAPTTLFPGGGVIGIQLFFVLSGFLITSLLLAEADATGRVNIRAFYGRRARRLVPALVVFLAFFALWSVVAQVQRWQEIAVSVTYIANWARVVGVDLDELNHTWSLAVEEQFYLVWPIAIVALVRFRRDWRILAIAAAALMAWRIGLAASGADWGRLYYATDTNAASLLAGAALAAAGVASSRRAPAAGVAAIAVLLALSFVVTGHSIDGQRFYVAVGAPIATMASLGLIVAAMNAGSGWLAVRPLVFLGAISYGLYLWHTGLNRIADLDYGWPVEARLILIPTSIVIAAASLRFVEARFRRRRVVRVIATEEPVPMPVAA